MSTLHEKEFEGATLQARLTERRSPRRSLVGGGGANNANSQQQSQQQQQQVPTHPCYQISQGNLIQGKAQLALKNWKNVFGARFGDNREDSLTCT